MVGGVSITDKSRIPSIDIWSVLGIGVAVNVKTSTWVFNSFRRSLCLTPKRCSSSIIIKPKSKNSTSLESKRWVPIIKSTRPFFNLARISVCCVLVWKRLRTSTFTPKLIKRSVKLLKCCSARTVVGTRTATCFPSFIALKAARIATSVLPKPTSPTNKRSIGRSSSISCLISLIERIWSSVSTYEKPESNSSWLASSGEKAKPFLAWRSA